MEQVIQNRLSDRFYEEVVSASNKKTESSLAELEHSLLGLPIKSKKLELEKALKETVERLNEMRETDPFRGSEKIALSKKPVIDEFSKKQYLKTNIRKWTTETKDLREFLHALLQDASSWYRYLSDESSERPINDKNSPSSSEVFQSHDFYFHLSDRYFEEVENVENICMELDEIDREIGQLPEVFPKVKNHKTNIRKRIIASDLNRVLMDIDDGLQKITEQTTSICYEHIYTDEDKNRFVASLVLYYYMWALKKQLSEPARVNVEEMSSADYRLPLKPDGRTEEEMKDAIDAGLRSLKKNGFLHESTTIDSFRSIFMPSATLIKGTRWSGNYKTLRYFIFRLVGRPFTVQLKEDGYGKKEGQYAVVKEFGHGSALSSEVKPVRKLSHRVRNCFLNDEGVQVDSDNFINDNNPGELDSDTMELLNTASDYLRGM